MKKIVWCIKQLFQSEYQNMALLTASGTFLLNMIIGVGKLLLGIYYLSDWLIANALYYIALAVAKGQILRKYAKIRNITDKTLKRKKELAVFEGSGIFQCVIGLTYFFVSLHTLLVGETESYPEYMMYLVVSVAFLKVGTAVYGMCRTRKEKSPVAGALKITDFTDAIVSIGVARSILQVRKGAVFATQSSGIFGIVCSIIFMAEGAIMLGYNRRKEKEGE